MSELEIIDTQISRGIAELELVVAQQQKGKNNAADSNNNAARTKIKTIRSHISELRSELRGVVNASLKASFESKCAAADARVRAVEQSLLQGLSHDDSIPKDAVGVLELAKRNNVDALKSLQRATRLANESESIGRKVMDRL